MPKSLKQLTTASWMSSPSVSSVLTVDRSSPGLAAQ
uniref:Uncharacterized protein n=1 Tax=Arundo donax TaxID=35708 RepID=A0A0A9H2A8_ARUDO